MNGMRLCESGLWQGAMGVDYEAASFADLARSATPFSNQQLLGLEHRKQDALVVRSPRLTAIRPHLL
jgi:hypothetical protein